MEDMKPCPFCGLDDYLCIVADNNRGKGILLYYVCCDRCGINGPKIWTLKSLEPDEEAHSQAKISWNDRAKK